MENLCEADDVVWNAIDIFVKLSNGFIDAANIFFSTAKSPTVSQYVEDGLGLNS